MGTEREREAGNAIIAFCEISAVARGCVFVELRVAVLEDPSIRGWSLGNLSAGLP